MEKEEKRECEMEKAVNFVGIFLRERGGSEGLMEKKNEKRQKGGNLTAFNFYSRRTGKRNCWRLRHLALLATSQQLGHALVLRTSGAIWPCVSWTNGCPNLEK